MVSFAENYRLNSRGNYENRMVLHPESVYVLNQGHYIVSQVSN